MSVTDKDEMAKMLRLFKLIEYLSAPPFYTTKELAKRLGVDRRTVERYYKLLEQLGYLIDKDEKHRYFLQVESGLGDSFDPAEAAYLNDLLQQSAEDDDQKRAILLKLNKQYRLTPLVQTLQRNSNYLKLRQLQDSVDRRKVVKLYNYVGAEGKVSNRRVAVTNFTEKQKAINAFDLDIQEDRLFVIARIGLVEVTADDVPVDLEFHPNDLFGWPGKEWKTVRLRLTRRAYQLLVEDYPAARPMVHEREEGRYLAELQIRGFEAVGRWVLGLPREVEVEEVGDGILFRQFLNKMTKNW